MLIGLSTFAQDLSDRTSPLDRLRNRSAEARWQQRRHQWFVPDDATSEETALSANGSEEPSEAAVIAPPPDSAVADLFQPDALPNRIESGPASPTELPVELKVLDAASGAPANRDVGFGAIETAPANLPDSVVNLELAPPAPRDAPARIADQQSAGVANLHTAPGAGPRPLPQSSQPLPLPDFLEGADPLWLAQKPLAAPYVDQDARTAESAGSQLITIQSEPMEPMEDRARDVLRRIQDINPFFDYNPDGGDPCEFLCPTPEICENDYLCPEEFPIPESGSPGRAHMNFYWAASNVYHNPLYFEDPVLERYGHVHFHDAVQPFFSMARFGAQLIGMPYQMALDPVHDRVYPLGFYRPGDPAPRLIYQPPLNARAAAAAAATYTGFFFLVP